MTTTTTTTTNTNSTKPHFRPCVRRLSESSGYLTTGTWTLSDDDGSVDQVHQQLADLKALLTAKDQRIAQLEQQVAQQQDELDAMQQQKQQQSVATRDDNDSYHNDDNNDDDSQVRDQIAAVKASLQQGRQQAKANQDSLEEEMETCRRLKQKLAHRKDQHPPTSKPKKQLTLSQQLTALLTTVQEREQSIAEIATSFHSNNNHNKDGGGTLPVSLYQAEIQQWKQALARLSQDAESADATQQQEQSHQLLQQAQTKLHQLEMALAQSQQDCTDQQARAQTLWQMVQRMEQDKQDEIHLLDIVMQHLLDLEQEQEKQQQQQEKQQQKKQSSGAAVEC